MNRTSDNHIPEMVGTQLALTIVLGSVFELLLRRQVATTEEILDVLERADQRSWFICKDLASMSRNDGQRILNQAKRTISSIAYSVRATTPTD
jgi:hypothetical protein